MQVIIGVDPHKASHTAIAIGDNEGELGAVKVRATRRQVAQLLSCERGGWGAERTKDRGQGSSDGRRRAKRRPTGRRTNRGKTAGRRAATSASDARIGHSLHRTQRLPSRGGIGDFSGREIPLAQGDRYHAVLSLWFDVERGHPPWFHDQGLHKLLGTIRYPKAA